MGNDILLTFNIVFPLIRACILIDSAHARARVTGVTVGSVCPGKISFYVCSHQPVMVPTVCI